MTLLVLTPQNGQTQLNNLSAFADELFEFVLFDHFAGLALKWLRTYQTSYDKAFLRKWLPPLQNDDFSKCVI